MSAINLKKQGNYQKNELLSVMIPLANSPHSSPMPLREELQVSSLHAFVSPKRSRANEISYITDGPLMI